MKTLKPRLQAFSATRVPVLIAQPDRVERKRGRDGVKDRNAIRERDQHCCRICGRLGTVVDHIVPLVDGGSDEPGNKQTLCTACHDEKTAREAAQRARGY